MKTIVKHKDSKIEIVEQPILKYAFLATEVMVLVDNVCIGKSGSFRIKDVVKGTFKTKDGVVNELEVHVSEFSKTETKVLLNGETIHERKSSIRNLFLALMGLAFVLLLFSGIVISIFAPLNPNKDDFMKQKAKLATLYYNEECSGKVDNDYEQRNQDTVYACFNSLEIHDIIRQDMFLFSVYKVEIPVVLYSRKAILKPRENVIFVGVLNNFYLFN